jgi:hypothetical protein
MPSFNSSPWIRGAPQSVLASEIVRISARTSADTVGRPTRRRLFHVQKQAEALTMPGDDSFRFDDDECGSPSGQRAGQPRPKPPVRRRQPQPVRSCPIQDLELVPQGEQFKLQCGARPKPTSERYDQRGEDGNHRHGAYPGTTRTSMVATRTAFSVATGQSQPSIADRQSADASSPQSSRACRGQDQRQYLRARVSASRRPLGHAQAIGAIAHRLCRLIWKILHAGMAYQERGPAVTKHREQRRAAKMIRELRALGYRVEQASSLPKRTGWNEHATRGRRTVRRSLMRLRR